MMVFKDIYCKCPYIFQKRGKFVLLIDITMRLSKLITYFMTFKIYTYIVFEFATEGI